MNDILEWCKRMNRLLKTDIIKTQNRVAKRCIYGKYHFCDGTINKSMPNSAKVKRPPCKNFRNGKCEITVHLPEV